MTDRNVFQKKLQEYIAHAICDAVRDTIETASTKEEEDVEYTDVVSVLFYTAFVYAKEVGIDELDMLKLNAYYMNKTYDLDMVIEEIHGDEDDEITH